MTRAVAGITLGLALLAAQALAGQEHQEQLKFGASTYRDICSHCHGMNMVNAGTSSFDLRRFPADDRERFSQSLNKGRGDMPAFGDILTEREKDALWLYVATRAGKEDAPASAATVASSALSADRTGLGSLVSPDTLTVCLAENGGAMSFPRASGDGGGLEFDLSTLLAQHLGLQLAVIWYESEPEEDTTPVRETVAMLSYGLCDLVPGFPLYASALEFHDGGRAALPDWEGRPASLSRRFQVDLQPIAGSRPYMRLELGLALRKGVEIGPVRHVRDLEGLRVGIAQSTLGGVITVRQGSDRMISEAVTLNPGPTFLQEMEEGRFDAALVSVGEFDAHRHENQDSELILHDYRHPIGFNLGIVALERNRDLLAAIDRAIEIMVKDGQIGGLAARNGVHYAPPREPFVQPRMTMRQILAIQ